MQVGKAALHRYWCMVCLHSSACVGVQKLGSSPWSIANCAKHPEIKVINDHSRARTVW